MIISSKEDRTDNVLTMKTGARWNSGLGQMVIVIDSASKTVCEWTIKCGANTAIFGISEFDANALNSWCFGPKSKWKCYGQHSSGGARTHSREPEGAQKLCRYGNADELILKVDTMNKTVEHRVNGKHALTHKGVEDGEYRLTVSLSGDNVSMEIVDFVQWQHK